MEVFREAPKLGAFVPLSEHQSATPASFYDGPPVLHYYSDRCKVLVMEDELVHAPALAALVSKSGLIEEGNGATVNGNAPHVEASVSMEPKVVEEVDVWVTSEKLLLYSNATLSGVAIPYPTISLHAIQSLPQPSPGEQQGVYMQLISTPTESADEDNEPDSIALTIIPTASAPPPAATEDDPVEEQPEQTPVVAMFTALSNCSNLHPDPIEIEDEEQGMEGSRLFQAGIIQPGNTEGGLPPALPGSGGWITAENMHEFVDEEGNWIGDEDRQEEESLGPGAGTVRTRGEDGALGGNGESEESKWQRTS